MADDQGHRAQLILHVGAPKTGSSAIQTALARSARRLRALGVLVPDAELGVEGKVEGQQVFFIEQCLAQPEVLARAIGKLDNATMPGAGLRAIVLSAENLLAQGAKLAKTLAGLREHFDVRIIAYVRRQDDFIASAWQQWYCKVHTDLWAWTISELGCIGNWWGQLQPWIDAFGRECIDVRLYPPTMYKDAVRDFFEACGLPFESALAKSDGVTIVNPSFNTAVQNLVEGNEGLFVSAHDTFDFFDAVHELLGDAVRRRPAEHLFGVAQRVAILQHYRSSNELLRATFFPEFAAPLFPDPPANGEAVARRRPVSVEELRQEVDLLAKLFFALYERSRPPA